MEEPTRAVYLAFNSDLAQMEKDLKELDKEAERVKMRGELSQKERKQTLADLGDTRKQILVRRRCAQRSPGRCETGDEESGRKMIADSFARAHLDAQKAVRLFLPSLAPKTYLKRTGNTSNTSAYTERSHRSHARAFTRSPRRRHVRPRRSRIAAREAAADAGAAIRSGARSRSHPRLECRDRRPPGRTACGVTAGSPRIDREVDRKPQRPRRRRWPRRNRAYGDRGREPGC